MARIKEPIIIQSDIEKEVEERVKKASEVSMIEVPEPTPIPEPTFTLDNILANIITPDLPPNPPVMRRSPVNPTGREPAPPQPQIDRRIPSQYSTDNYSDNYESTGRPFPLPQQAAEFSRYVHNLHHASAIQAPADIDARYAVLGIDRSNPQHPLHGQPVDDNNSDK